MTGINDELLGSLSEDDRDLDRKLPEDVSLFTAVSKEKRAISAPAIQMISSPAIHDGPPEGGVDQTPPQAGTLYAVVGIIMLLSCCLPWCGCLKLRTKDAAFDK